ncbi:MAG: hypothetical protein OHK0031_09380 [Anaerolineales bacterium]
MRYTQDLTLGGIEYALRSLPYTYNRMGGSLYSRLRRIVGGVAVELALRRLLADREIPFDVRGATPFTEPDRYDVALGGHRCDVKTFILSKRQQIAALRRDPSPLLRAPALVPEDQFLSENHSEQDLYIFAFLLGLTTNSQEEIDAAAQANQPLYLVHPLQAAWSHPPVWQSLGRLTLKSECAAPLTVELGGQDASRAFVTEQISLPPKTRVFAQNDFFNLAYLHVKNIPAARIGLHSPTQPEIYLISPRDWGNIWIYGMDIWLTGYLPREEFHRKASAIPAGSPVFQYSRTQTKNFAVPVADLRPLDTLLQRVKNWKQKNT